ncbi:MAG: ECF transporter S component [Lachnospiraceae bacterium]|nr:ECF transporter S component [Lachnospiraceae bacterium]
MEQTETEQKEQRKESGHSQSFYRAYKIALIGIFSAISFVLMLFEFPLPMIAPPSYKMGFSELPIMIGAFALGPVAGIIIDAVKVLLNLLIQGTQTGGVGEFASFVIGAAYVLPAALIYSHRKTKKNAVIGLSVSLFTVVVVGSLMNAFVLLPMYIQLYFHGDKSILIAMGTEVHAQITDITTFVLLAVAPFNLIKYGAISIITMLIYKHISRVLKNPLEKV